MKLHRPLALLAALAGLAAAAPFAVTLLLPIVPDTIALYPLDEGSGTVTTELTGSAFAMASMEGNVQWTWALGSPGLVFHDEDESVGKPAKLYVPPIDVGSVYTIQAWTSFPLESGYGYGNSLCQGNESNQHLSVSSDQEFGIMVDGSWYGFSYYTYSVSADWHLVSVATDGSRTWLFIDDSEAGNVDAVVTSSIQYIGNGDGSSVAWGVIDCFRVVLEGRQNGGIAEDFNAGAPLTKIKDTADLYLFNEGSGGQTASSIPLQGLLRGGTAWVNGISGKAVDFATADARLDIAPVDVGATWTIQAWSRFPLATNATGWRDLALNWNSHHVIVDKDGFLGTYPNTFVSSGFNVNDVSGWHLVTAVGSGAQTTFYLDDQKVGIAAAKVGGAVNYVGNHPNNSQNWGVIDSIRILKVARSEADIAADANPLPGAPSTMKQWNGTSGAEVLKGGACHGIFDAAATVSDPTQGRARLQVEVKPIGQVLDGSGLRSGDLVASGAEARIRVADLAPGTYHWRGRVQTERNAVSPWLAFGGNPETELDIALVNGVPVAGTAAQVRATDGGELPAGGQVGNLDGVRFVLPVSDSDGDAVTLEVEVVTEGSAFRGVATSASGGVAAGPAVSVSALFNQGVYVWRSRVVDSMGAATAWVGSDANRFVVEFSGSTGPQSCAGSAGGSMVLLAAMAVLALQLRR